MFTRTNIAIGALLFLFFFIFLLVFCGERGILVQKQIKERSRVAILEVDRKQAQVELMRRNEGIAHSGDDENAELILSFQNEPYSPMEESMAIVVGEYKGLSLIAIAGLSLIPSILYFIICFIVKKKRGKF